MPDTHAVELPAEQQDQAESRDPAEFFRRLELLPMTQLEFATRSGVHRQQVQRWEARRATFPEWAWRELRDLELIKQLERSIPAARRRGPVVPPDRERGDPHQWKAVEFFRRLAEVPMPRSRFAARSGYRYRQIQHWVAWESTIPGWAWTMLHDLEYIRFLLLSRLPQREPEPLPVESGDNETKPTPRGRKKRLQPPPTET